MVAKRKRRNDDEFNVARREQIYFPNPERRNHVRALAASEGKGTSEFINDLVRRFEQAQSSNQNRPERTEKKKAA